MNRLTIVYAYVPGTCQYEWVKTRRKLREYNGGHQALYRSDVLLNLQQMSRGGGVVSSPSSEKIIRSLIRPLDCKGTNNYFVDVRGARTIRSAIPQIGHFKNRANIACVEGLNPNECVTEAHKRVPAAYYTYVAWIICIPIDRVSIQLPGYYSANRLRFLHKQRTFIVLLRVAFDLYVNIVDASVHGSSGGTGYAAHKLECVPQPRKARGTDFMATRMQLQTECNGWAAAAAEIHQYKLFFHLDDLSTTSGRFIADLSTHLRALAPLLTWEAKANRFTLAHCSPWFSRRVCRVIKLKGMAHHANAPTDTHDGRPKLCRRARFD